MSYRKEQLEILAKLSLSLAMPQYRDLSEADIKKICDFSYVMSDMDMSDIVLLFQEEVLDRYISHPEDRPYIDTWLKNPNFAGLTLEDFIARAKNDT